jgi:hypothetical protein
MGAKNTRQRLLEIAEALPSDVCRHIHDYWLLLSLRVALKKQWKRVLTRCARDRYTFYGKDTGEYGLRLVRLNHFYWHHDGIRLAALDVSLVWDCDEEQETGHTLLVFDCNYRQLRNMLGGKVEGAEKIVYVH